MSEHPDTAALVETVQEGLRERGHFASPQPNVALTALVERIAELERGAPTLLRAETVALAERNRADAAEAKLAEAEQALRKHGIHGPECSIWGVPWLGREVGDWPCSCGYAAALRSLRVTEPEDSLSPEATE